jgi:phosphomethylpyrimidine synthase
MEAVAKQEGMDPALLIDRIASGQVVILKNRIRRTAVPVGVGKGLRTKVNANIGTSTDFSDSEAEKAKAATAVRYGADTVMDLSTGGDLPDVLKQILDTVPVPVGTVPVYEAAVHAIRIRGALTRMTETDLFSALHRQAKAGVDFFTVHCGVTRASIERMRHSGRIMDIVSRGGSFLAAWIAENDRENPLYERYDRILDIAREYDVTLSLGDGMRPGSVLDATDRPQIQELVILGELANRAREAGVQVMIEGPGHVPLDLIQANIQIQKRLCGDSPFYVLGPLVTDVAPGYDHITSAIGGAIAAAAGADFLCYVTPGEHLKLPDLEEVRQGVVASRIAAHAADLVKGLPGAMDWDRRMSEARRALNWNQQIALAIDPDRARALRESAPPLDDGVCTMCGEFCAIKLTRDVFPHNPVPCGGVPGN